jgi:hypothetical protein
MPNDTCSIDGCDTPPRMYRLYCHRHYRRWKRHGDPLFTLTPTKVIGTLEERFYSKVADPDSEGCTLWKSGTTPAGYGCFSLNGTTIPAHRLSYQMSVGPIPEGLDLDHLCHTWDKTCVGKGACKHRRCVNPQHLEPVTPKENSRRGRSPIAANALKTHCDSGHEFTPENTYMRARGGRQCVICRRVCDKKRYYKNKAKQQ